MKKAEELYQIISRGLAQFARAGNEPSVEDALNVGETTQSTPAEIEEMIPNDIVEIEEKDSPSTTINLQEMFLRRNQVVSSGALKSSSETISQTDVSISSINPSATSETNSKDVHTDSTSSVVEDGDIKAVNSDEIDHPELLRLESVFQGGEPQLTNWSGEFEG